MACVCEEGKLFLPALMQFFFCLSLLKESSPDFSVIYISGNLHSIVFDVHIKWTSVLLGERGGGRVLLYIVSTMLLYLHTPFG